MKRLAIALAALAVAAPAAASESRPTLAELEGEFICPTCNTTLDQSDAPIARRMRRYIAARIAAGDSKSEIKDKLVARFGRSVLAAPPREGFDLLAWLLPLAALGAGGVAVGVLAWRWSREREPASLNEISAESRTRLDPELERRLDEELARFE